MLPILTVGTVHFSTYAVVYALALVVAGMWSFHRLYRGSIQSRIAINHVVNGVLLAVGGGFLGAFVLYSLLLTLLNFLLTGKLSLATENSFIGALAGGLGAGFYYCRRHSLPLGRALDVGGLPVPLGQAIGNLGCLAAGCCHGKPTHSWLGLSMPDGNGVWLVRYPTPLISLGLDLLILATLLAVERYGIRRVGKTRSWPFDGFLALLYVALYCLKRFGLEFLRNDSVPVFGPLSWVHVYTAGGFIAAMVLMAWKLSRGGAPADDRCGSGVPASAGRTTPRGSH